MFSVASDNTTAARRERLCDILDRACAQFRLTRKESAAYYGCSETMWTKVLSGQRTFDLDRIVGFPDGFRQYVTAAIAAREGLTVSPTQTQEESALSMMLEAVTRYVSIHERRKHPREVSHGPMDRRS